MFAGILLIYYTFFHEEKPRRLKLIFGSLLIVFAIMIRQDISFPLIISALMLLSLEIATRSKLRAIFSLRRRGKISRQEGSVSPLREPLKSRIKNAGGDIKKLLCFALICLLLFAMRYPLSAIDSLAYRSDEWQAYKTYNLARNKLYDYPKTDETMDILQEIGLTDNDIEMLYGYYFYDKQLLFDEDNLELLSQISTSSDFSLGSIFGRFKNSFYSFSFALEHRGFRPMLFFMFIIGIGLLLLVSDKRSTLLYLLLSIEVGLNICVFLVLGRYPTRVTVPTALFALLAFMLYMAENTDKIKRRKRTLAFWGGLCAVCASIFILLPNFIAVSHAPVKPDYMDDVINSPKTVYILSDDRSFDYSISWMENPLSPENLVYTESWSMYSPISEARMKESGVDGNPLIYMLDNENVVYMTSWMPRIQAISIYLYEHHGIIAIAEPIAEYESGMVFYKFKTVPEDGEMPSYLKEYLERVN
ncbi:MAG: hypothetical protein LBL82_02515 [Oscillospiraceae bacterium]|jgi:hypothetical protein|nr:hypothetical protein [Oscillospiraceae bacterium]